VDYKRLIEHINAKDQESVKALYVEYGERLYSFAVDKWNFTEDEAWDIIYQTLYSIFQKGDNYEIESKKHFENFLYKVFKNNLRQAYRKKRRDEGNLTFLALNENTIEASSMDGNFHSTIERMDTVSANQYYEGNLPSEDVTTPIRVALKKLNKNDRDLLLLRSQNFSYKEIANLMKIEDDQLKVKYYRAKKKLIKLLTSEAV
jgi:RNA polymerase sigma-70 factor (ECF subfamily)